MVTFATPPTGTLQVNIPHSGSELAPLQAMEALIERSKSTDVEKADYAGLPSSFMFNPEALIYQTGVAGSGLASLPMGMTDWAHRQLLDKMASSLFKDERTARTMRFEDWEALRRNFPVQYASVFNQLLTTSKARGLLVRGYQGNARAILSKQYAKLDNTPMLEAIYNAIKPEAHKIDGLRIVRSSVNSDDLNLYMVWKDVPDERPAGFRPGDGGTLLDDPTRNGSRYGIGIYISNGEIGNRGIRFSGLIQRHGCTNSIIVDSEDMLRIRHIGEPTALLAMVKTTMLNMLPIAADMLAKVFQAEIEQLPSFADVINGLSKQHGWSEKFTDAVKIGTEGQETRMGLVNGISWAAHRATKDANQEADMSTLAGKILVAPDSLFAKAAQVVHQKV